MDDELPALCDLECEVMTLVCADGPIAADALRGRLPRPPDESHIPTLLRRLEEKGYVAHVVEGRTSLYWAKQPRGQAVANCRELRLLAEAVRQARSLHD
jgi:BlaI family penicillinase repressor